MERRADTTDHGKPNKPGSLGTRLARVPLSLGRHYSYVPATRWSRETKRRYPGAAELPIVRVNPQNILGAKASEEVSVRAAGLPYCIVRPCNLDEEYVSEGGYVLSSGDVATGSP